MNKGCTYLFKELNLHAGDGGIELGAKEIGLMGKETKDAVTSSKHKIVKEMAESELNTRFNEGFYQNKPLRTLDSCALYDSTGQMVNLEEIGTIRTVRGPDMSRYIQHDFIMKIIIG
jgi:hypothetical protein